jgi:hypothetical protein
MYVASSKLIGEVWLHLINVFFCCEQVFEILSNSDRVTCAKRKLFLDFLTRSFPYDVRAAMRDGNLLHCVVLPLFIRD